MVSTRALIVAAVLAGSPLPAQTSQSLFDSPKPQTTAVTPPATAPVELDAEKRADILMARKMYREAVEMYKESPQDSAVIANKIGIAYHQMLQVDAAKRYYEKAAKIDAQYPEAINNLDRK